MVVLTVLTIGIKLVSAIRDGFVALKYICDCCISIYVQRIVLSAEFVTFERFLSCLHRHHLTSVLMECLA